MAGYSRPPIKKTKRKIKENSVIMAKVISVSMVEGQYKIGLTMRQPGLGALEWLKEEKKEAPRAAEKKADKKPGKK